jgi:hypothetical protein
MSSLQSIRSTICCFCKLNVKQLVGSEFCNSKICLSENCNSEIKKKNVEPFHLVCWGSARWCSKKKYLSDNRWPVFEQGSMLWSQFSAIFLNFWRKIGVFLKYECYDHFFQKLALFWVHTKRHFLINFWRKYLKNHNIGPRFWSLQQ